MAEMENRTPHDLIREKEPKKERKKERGKNTYISKEPLLTVWKPFGKYAGRVRYEMFLSMLGKGWLN